MTEEKEQDWCWSILVLGYLCHLDKADGGEGSSENDKEGDCLSD